MDRLQLALAVQLTLYVLAIAAVVVATVRAVKLQRQAAQHPGGNAAWWDSPAARPAIGHAIKPLWLTVAALLLGAFAPRLLGAMGG